VVRRRGGQGARDAVIDDRLGECVELVVRNVVVGESHRDGVSAGKRRPGQRGVQTKPARRPGQQKRPADVGDEADADLRHSHLRRFGHHPDVRVRGNADSAAITMPSINDT